MGKSIEKFSKVGDLLFIYFFNEKSSWFSRSMGILAGIAHFPSEMSENAHVFFPANLPSTQKASGRALFQWNNSHFLQSKQKIWSELLQEQRWESKLSKKRMWN